MKGQTLFCAHQNLVKVIRSSLSCNSQNQVFCPYLKTSLNKADISGPTDFIHIQGTKQSHEGGFSKIDNLSQIDPNLKVS